MASNITPEILAKAKQIVAEEFYDLSHRFVRRMTLERLSKRGPSSLGVRTGQLRRSIGVAVQDRGATKKVAIAFIGGGLPYARIHEEGGTITPKRSKYLAIPVGGALTPAGVHRFGVGPRGAGDLKFIVSKRTGAKLLVRATIVNDEATGKQRSIVKQFKRGRGYKTKTGEKKKTKLDVLYVLVPSVTIPARLGFNLIFDQERKATLAKIQARVRNLGTIRPK